MVPAISHHGIGRNGMLSSGAVLLMLSDAKTRVIIGTGRKKAGFIGKGKGDVRLRFDNADHTR